MYYDNKKAEKVIKFVNGLCHTKGKWAGVPFSMLPWQYQAIGDIFGTMRDNGRRQYNMAYLELEKKMGKSELCAALALYGLCADGEWSAEVYGAAADRAQASIIFDVAVNMVDQNKTLKKHIKPVLSQKRLIYKPTKSFYQVLSAEAYCLHPDTTIEMSDGSRKQAKHIIVGDEILSWKNKKLVFAKVSSVETQPPSCLYKIKTHRNREIIVTGEHRFLTMKRGRRNQDLTHEYYWLKAKDIKTGDRLKIAIGWPESYLESNLDLLECWALGAWTGDGECGRFRFINADQDVITDMQKFMKSIGSNLLSEYSTRQKQKGKISGVCHEHLIKGNGKGTKSAGREWVRKHFGQSSRAHNKTIPSTIFENGPIAWAAFLAGWMDTDGCIPNLTPVASWSSRSDKLLKEGQSLLARLGINATISGGCLRVSGIKQLIKLAEVMIPHMRCSYKKEKLITKSKEIRVTNFNAHVADRVTTIETLSPQETISLEVEGAKTHVTNGIITHNTKHGLNISMAVIDELHAQPNRDLYDVLTEGAGDAREQPLTLVVSTAGDDPDRKSIGWHIHQMAVDILTGAKIDPTFYAMIYGLDRENKRLWTGRQYETIKEKIEDEEVWRKYWSNPVLWEKINPSLNHTVSLEKVKDQCNRAVGNVIRERNFRWLRLNSWEKIKTSKWLGLDFWDLCKGKIDLNRLKGRTCYGGLDLSSKIDMTSFVLAFPPDDINKKWSILPWFWVPEARIRERTETDKVPYDIWTQQGFIKTTPGDVIDYDFIKSEILKTKDIYDIQEIGFDPWNAMQVALQLQDEGLTMVEIRQGFKAMSPAMKEIEQLVRGKKLVHNGHPVLRWNIGNVEIKQDENEYIKPVKGKNTERIDGLVALIMALDRAMRHQDNKSVYEERGILAF